MSTFRPDPKPDYTGQKLAKKAAKQRDKTNAARSHSMFYKSVWATNLHHCFECHLPVHVFSKNNIHHLVEKRFQPRYSENLDNTENGVILCWTCHNQVHTDISKTPRVQARAFIMKQQYEKFRIR